MKKSQQLQCHLLGLLLFSGFLNSANSLSNTSAYAQTSLSISSPTLIAEGNVEDFVEESRRFISQQRYEEALVALDKALQLQPNNVQALHSLGLLLSSLNRQPEALVAFDKLIQTDPRNADAEIWYKRGYALGWLERYQEALASYNKALELQPDGRIGTAQVWINQGALLAFDLKRYQEGYESIARGITFSPESDKEYVGKALVRIKLALKSYKEALDITDNLILTPQSDLYIWYLRGQALFKLKRYQEALEAYAKDPWSSIGLYRQGRVLIELGRLPEALTKLDQAIKVLPSNNHAWHVRGIVLSRLERYDEAIASYNKAIYGTSQNIYGADQGALYRDTDVGETPLGKADSWYGKGVALAKLKRYKEAVASLDEAIKLKPNFSEAIQARQALR